MNDNVIAELDGRITALFAIVSAMELELDDQFEAQAVYEEGEGQPNWAYKVTPGDGLEITVSGGNRVVIHKSVAADGDQGFQIPANSTKFLYIEYTYGLDGGPGTWGSFTLGGEFPAESTTKRVFRIAQITASSDSIESISHNHVGDLEVYEITEC
jgi:hypothetical protein